VTPPSAPAGTTVRHTFRAMATDVSVRLENRSTADADLALVEAIFDVAERECTRFNPTSALMRANAAGLEWCEVPEFCFAALQEAFLAYERTDGLFDPRVLRALTSLGYDRTLPFGQPSGPSSIELSPALSTAWGVRSAAQTTRWTPDFDVARHAVRVGPEPIDLGGIGKGLAVRWASEALRSRQPAFLIEAGGDCYLAGTGPVDGRWNVAVEDPAGGADPVAVLSLSDQACTTSSTRYRSWRVAGRPVHHLIDPRTGEPGTGGVRAVTIVDADPAHAEVWSKALFIRGLESLADEVGRRNLAALWIDEAGTVAFSPAMAPYVIWQAVR